MGCDQLNEIIEIVKGDVTFTKATKKQQQLQKGFCSDEIW
jgi:hypothetical protein